MKAGGNERDSRKKAAAKADIAGGCVKNQWEESARSWGITYTLEPEAKKRQCVFLWQAGVQSKPAWRGYYV